MKKRYILIGIVVLMLGGLLFKLGYNIIPNLKSNDTESDYIQYDTYTYLSETVKKEATTSIPSVEFEKAYTPEYMLELSDTIALVSIISVDSADTKIDPAVGSTYGKLVVNNVLSGSLKQGDVIEYIKSGGIMTLEEWEKNQIDGAREKREEMRKEAGIDATKTYVNFHYENDPSIEEGKVYLCYLKYSENLDKYEILGLGNGFRELNIPKESVVSAKTYSITDYKILNNETGEYESLNNYVQKYINTSVK